MTGPIPRELTVLLGGQPAGIVARGTARSGHTLTYDPAWRADPRAYPLSLSLPLASSSHEGQGLEYYLRGLLPDSEARLNLLAHRFGVPADDPFALLACIGEDCPGAVQLVRPDRLAGIAGAGPASIEWLTEQDLAGILRGLRAENAGLEAAVSTGQFSLPGALAKVALTWDPDQHRWGRPTGRAPSTHILKPPLAGVPHHNENEHLALALAGELQLRAATTTIIRAEGEQALAVTRFDRVQRSSVILRLHQEDMAQALGRNPRLRYAAEGAPDIPAIVGLLRDHASDSVDDVQRFLRAVALNWVLAGTDAHARNYAVLLGPGAAVTLAPLYDVASALLLPTKAAVEDQRLAMAIAGRTRLGEITRATWVAQARLLRLDPVRFIADLTAFVDTIPAALERLESGRASERVDERFVTRFVGRVRARATACARELGRGKA